jgi:hypothetical protein
MNMHNLPLPFVLSLSKDDTTLPYRASPFDKLRASARTERVI